MDALATAMVVMGMSLAATSAQSAEIIVFSTISAKEALIELVPEFERASGHKINITYAGGSGLAKQIPGEKLGDLFIGPEVADQQPERTRLLMSAVESGLDVLRGNVPCSQASLHGRVYARGRGFTKPPQAIGQAFPPLAVLNPVGSSGMRI